MTSFRAAIVGLWMLASVPPVFGQLVIAHRGASHDAPENTLSAFKLAIEQNADGFEADFYLTADGEVVCFHDKDTERLCGKRLIVAEATLDELLALDVGSWKGAAWRGEKMPTMKAVLDAVPDDKTVFLELKTGPEIVGPMAGIIEASSLKPEQIVVISFNEEAIAECKKRLPHIKTQWLCRYKKRADGRMTPDVEEVAAGLKRSGADALGSEAAPEHFDEAFITRLRELGCREFGVWTVDDPEVARFYERLGAWSITTNRPGWLRERMSRGDER